MELDELKSAISKLSEDQRKQLLSDLKLERYDKGSYLDEVLKKQEQDVPHACPKCGSTNVWSRGSYKGVKRLQCNDCKKYFSSTSGTALYHIHKKDKWQAYLQCMEEGLTLRQSVASGRKSYNSNLLRIYFPC